MNFQLLGVRSKGASHDSHAKDSAKSYFLPSGHLQFPDNREWQDDNSYIHDQIEDADEEIQRFLVTASACPRIPVGAYWSTDQAACQHCRSEVGGVYAMDDIARHTKRLGPEDVDVKRHN